MKVINMLSGSMASDSLKMDYLSNSGMTSKRVPMFHSYKNIPPFHKNCFILEANSIYNRLSSESERRVQVSAFGPDSQVDLVKYEIVPFFTLNGNVENTLIFHRCLVYISL